MSKDTYTYRDHFRPVFDQFAALRDALPASTGKKPVVAILDTGIWHNHPNLKSGIDTENLADFSLHDQGQRPFATAPTKAENRNRLKTLVANIRKDLAAGGKFLPSDNEELKVFADDSTSTRPIPLDWRFNAHGTAIAGLIGASLGEATLRSPHDETNDGFGEITGFSLTNVRVQLDFQGVCPQATMVPISTGFDNRALPLINALLYAYSLNPDVIVLPRDLPSAASFNSPQSIASRARPGDEDRKVAIDVLAKVVEAVASEIPFFCAAGNEGSEAMIFPASDRNTIAVGARPIGNKEATSYSNGSADLLAPSGDSEVQDRDRVVVNFHAPGLDKTALPPQLNEAEHGTYQTQKIISTDLAGAYGYNPSGDFEAYDGEGGIGEPTRLPSPIRDGDSDADPLYRDLTPLYSFFSGTSAAVAIAGGLAALMIASGVKPTVREMEDVLSNM